MKPRKEIKIFAFNGPKKTNVSNHWAFDIAKKKFDMCFVNTAEESDYIFVINYHNNDYSNSVIKSNLNKIIIVQNDYSLQFNKSIVDYCIGYERNETDDRYIRNPGAHWDQFYGGNEDCFFDLTNNKRHIRKNKFCNFIYSHKHKCRDQFFNILNSYKKVDSFNHMRNVHEDISGRFRKNWRSSSIEKKKGYKFSISFENASSSGYNTEKIFTSMLANTIPIYWGDLDIGDYYNTRSFINCHDYNDFYEVLERVKELDQNDEKYIEMYNEPWKTESQKESYEHGKMLFHDWFCNIFGQPYRSSFKKKIIKFI